MLICEDISQIGKGLNKFRFIKISSQAASSCTAYGETAEFHSAIQTDEIAHEHVATTFLQYDTKARFVPYPLPHKTTETVDDSEHGHESCSQLSH